MPLHPPPPSPPVTQRELWLELHFTLGARRELLLERALSPAGVTLRLLGGSRALSVSLEAQPAGEPFGALTGMPLARFRIAVMAALRSSWLGTDDGSAWRRDVAQLRQSVAEAWCHLEARLAPRAWALARGFPPRLRWAVYEALAADGTGRLAQLADAVPGALSLALVHAAQSDAQGAEAARAFRDAVVEGQPVRKALDPLLEDWSLLGCRVTLRGEARRLQALAEAPLQERRERILHQRTLLRRVLAGVDGRLVWLPAPVAFVPEDVPATLEAQQRWFRTLKRFPAFYGEGPRVPPRVQDAFVRWLSAHAAQPLPLGWTPDSLSRGVFSREAVLPRRLAPHRLAGKLDAWEREDWEDTLQVMEEMNAEAYFPETSEDGGELFSIPCVPWAERLQALAETYPAQVQVDRQGQVDLSLPNPFGGCELPGFRLSPLTTASALEAEGRTQQHCVAEFVEAAAAGTAFFFHAEAAGMGLTVYVRGPAAQARLEQVLGECNRAPGPEQRALVVAWWEGLARTHGLDPTVREPPTVRDTPTVLPECPF
ncbi:MAG: PcfJ-like protein [Pseudomonadota bacterium]|jgi:hypothetical protein